MNIERLIHILIFVLILIATIFGAFTSAAGPHIEIVTPRGQRALFQGGGLYKYDPVTLVREGVIWDTINLFIGLPILALAIFLASRNALRGRLLLGGMLAYFFYVYLMYATMMALNFLFLVYVAIFAFSLVGFFFNLRNIDMPRLPERIGPRFPRTLFIIFSFTLSGALLLLWLGRIIPIISSERFPDELAGLTTLETQALDLGLIVPLALTSGILLLRRTPWGYYLTSVAISFGFMMFITIPAWIFVPLLQDGKINFIEALPFTFLCLLGLALVLLFYTSIRGETSVEDSKRPSKPE